MLSARGIHFCFNFSISICQKQAQHALRAKCDSDPRRAQLILLFNQLSPSTPSTIDRNRTKRSAIIEQTKLLAFGSPIECHISHLNCVSVCVCERKLASVSKSERFYQLLHAVAWLSAYIMLVGVIKMRQLTGAKPFGRLQPAFKLMRIESEQIEPIE